jgi:hypothetical protein
MTVLRPRELSFTMPPTTVPARQPPLQLHARGVTSAALRHLDRDVTVLVAPRPVNRI